VLRQAGAHRRETFSREQISKSWSRERGELESRSLAVLPSSVRYFTVLPHSRTEGEANVLDNSDTRGNLHRTGDQRLPAGRVLISFAVGGSPSAHAGGLFFRLPGLSYLRGNAHSRHLVSLSSCVTERRVAPLCSPKPAIWPHTVALPRGTLNARASRCVHAGHLGKHGGFNRRGEVRPPNLNTYPAAAWCPACPTALCNCLSAARPSIFCLNVLFRSAPWKSGLFRAPWQHVTALAV
jgi:hypothetical protein